MRLLLSILSLSIFVSISAQSYKTEALSTKIHTIQLNKNADWKQHAVIKMNEADFVRLNFDYISDDSFEYLRYKIIHCNADWLPSSMSEIEYLDGFNDNSLDDYSSSSNTTIMYTNYRLDIPNKDVRLKLSGNYVILVYEDGNSQDILLSACFTVLDSQIAMSGNFTSNTLIDSNREHQQLSFIINHSALNIMDPYNSLKIFARQNGRTDNQKSDIKPTFVQAQKLIYEQKRELIFEAGNEYRRFETPSYKYNGLRVLRVDYNRPYYYATIFEDKKRANTRYVYDEDRGGRYFIRNAEGRDSDTDADYFYVKFSLAAETPFTGNVYLNGAFTYDTFSDKYQMEYDYTLEEYSTTLLLKQGAYNYQYLTNKGEKFSTSDVEGNYYETENEYQILVYYRLPGQRYDSFIGYLEIRR